MKIELYENILDAIRVRERRPIPLIFNQSLPKINKSFHTKTEFKLKNNLFNLNDYVGESLFFKKFSNNDDDVHFQKISAIVFISDANDEKFYLYIKLHFKYDVLFKYRVVYSLSFNDLILSLYKKITLPDFLNSSIFVSQNDKTTEQQDIIDKYNEFYVIKHITINNINFTIDLHKRTIITKDADDKIYKCRFNGRKDRKYIELLLSNSDRLHVSKLTIDDLCNLYKIIISNEVTKIFTLKNVNNQQASFSKKNDNFTKRIKVNDIEFNVDKQKKTLSALYNNKKYFCKINMKKDKKYLNDIISLNTDKFKIYKNVFKFINDKSLVIVELIEIISVSDGVKIFTLSQT
jgi:hypothetical protein